MGPDLPKYVPLGCCESLTLNCGEIYCALFFKPSPGLVPSACLLFLWEGAGSWPWGEALLRAVQTYDRGWNRLQSWKPGGGATQCSCGLKGFSRKHLVLEKPIPEDNSG